MASGAAASEVPTLVPYAVLKVPAAREASALHKSRRYPGVYWTLNDSRNGNYIFAFTRSGEPIGAGVRVAGAENKDWEALAADDAGNLIIADAGNNANKRKNLSVYVVPEPDPRVSTVTLPASRVNFRYPDQDGFPPKKKNFDSEALFWADGRLYLLTKHRDDTRTKLYAFGPLEAGKEQVLKLVGSFDAGAMVTDAAAGPGGRLAVLTYDGAWLFEKPARPGGYFSGAGKRFSFGAGQCEGITFEDEETLLVGNEERELFELKVSSFVRPGR